MKVKLSTGRELAVFIDHASPNPALSSAARQRRYAQTFRRLDNHCGTVATVREGGEEYVGRAKLAGSDQFNRHKGLTIALRRALAQTDLSKAERHELWDKVFAGKYAACS